MPVLVSLVLVFVALTAAPAAAQESRFQSDLRREREDLRSSCGGGLEPKKIVDCVVAVATEDPFHVAIGSLAPLNGTGFGVAFAEHYTPNEQWRISWNADSVFAASGSWRAGAYMKLIHIPKNGGITVVRPGATQFERPSTVRITEYPVYNVYAQTIALETVALTSGQNLFSERQTIIGGNTIYPLTGIAAIRGLRPALVGAVNGRLLNLQSDSPLLAQTPSFVQFEEGIRIRPSIVDDRLRLNYLLDFQQFAETSDTHASFRRWSVDLRHEFPLYHTVSSTGPKDTNGPDECFQSVGSRGCAPVSYSRNREGTVNVRLLAIRSDAGDDNAVPFYFQPTLGGSDINGQRLLSAYDDYQFRGPNLIALQESVEHSVWGPIGAYLMLEQGNVTQAGEGLGFGNLANSVAIGLTVRAGGFPLINLSFAWGGGGHHIVGSIDPSLLGGSSRPSLY